MLDRQKEWEIEKKSQGLRKIKGNHEKSKKKLWTKIFYLAKVGAQNVLDSNASFPRIVRVS